MAFVAYLMLGESGSVAAGVIAVGYGSMLALTGTMISARSAQRSSDFAATGSNNMAMVPIFSGLVLKLVIMGGGVGLGLVLGLDAIPLLVAFAVVKMSSIFAILTQPIVKS